VGQERERGREQKQLEQLGLIFPAASASSSSKVRGHRLCRGHTHCQCRQLGCECSPQALMPGWKCRNGISHGSKCWCKIDDKLNSCWAKCAENCYLLQKRDDMSCACN